MVTITTGQQGSEVVVEVRDTGSGIAPEHLDRLFEPFFTTRQYGEGSGLGLSVSLAIIERYGGSIDVTSQPGVGSRFTVRLPVAAGVDRLPADEGLDRLPAAVPPRGAALGPGPDELAGGRVLVVDDDDGARAALARMLAGHNVLQASGGVEAKLILNDDRSFDAIICDVMMADLSGIDLHRWLLAEDPALAARLVFVTGGVFTPVAQEYLCRAANLRLSKPVDVAQLRAMVATLCRAWRENPTV